ncbi:MAG: metal ABC transporter permease [Spirochaetota bacterium]
MATFLADLFKYTFLQYALIAGLLSSVACGIIGSYVTVRRITYIAGAIAHSVLGGMGAARYLNIVAGIKFLNPLHGAVFAAVVSALIIGAVTVYSKQREDTVLSAIWAVGMAFGILFIYATPGYSEDLMSYLFGNILMVRKQDLFLMLFLDLIIIVVTFLFYNRILSIAFDNEYARLKGIKVEVYTILLLVLTALTIVIMAQVVGIVMVIALLALPAASASTFAKRLWQMMLYSITLSVIYTTGGLIISYKPNLPSGAVIIIFSGAVYILLNAGKRILHAIRMKHLY